MNGLSFLVGLLLGVLLAAAVATIVTAYHERFGQSDGDPMPVRIVNTVIPPLSKPVSK